MAQLALGLAGAVVGTIIAPGIGTSIGFALGSAAGGVIERSMQKPIEGPRVQDMQINSSSYGSTIPEIRGVVRLPGILLERGELINRRRRTGGKGGDALSKAPKQNQYKAFRTFAFGFCAGGAGYQLLRLRADAFTIFDRTGATEAIGLPGLVWRFYDGRETQLPDPAIEAIFGTEAEAHRGWAYVVCDTWPLEPFGNRIPQLSADIAATDVGADVTRTTVNLSTGNGNPISGPSNASSFSPTDWTRRKALRVITDGSQRAVAWIDVVSGLELRVKTIDAMHEGTEFTNLAGNVSTVGIVPGGAAFMAAGSAVTTCLTRFDPETLTVTGQHPYVDSSLTWNRSDRMPGVKNITTTSVLTGTSTRPLVLCTTYFNAPRIVDGHDMISIWGMGEGPGGSAIYDAPDFEFQGSFGEGNLLMVGGEQRLGETDVWILTSGSPTAVGTDDQRRPHLQRVRVGAAAGFIPEYGKTMNLIYSTVAMLEHGDVHPGATLTSVSGLQYDPTDNTLVFVTRQHAGSASNTYGLCKVTIDGTVVWTAALSGDPQIPSGHAKLDGTKYANIGSSTGNLVDLSTGVVETFTNPNSGAGAYVFDGVSRSAVFLLSGGVQKRAWVDRADVDPPSLQSVVTWACGRATLEPSDIDVSGLTGEVPGLATGVQPVRGVLDQLRGCHFFDFAEVDWQLKFVHRGRASAATIAYSELVRPDREGPAIRQTRIPEAEIPRRVTVNYRDLDKDQQSGAAQWSRQHSPIPIVSSVGEATVDLSNLALAASTAKGVARVSLTTQWAERTRIEDLTLPPSRMALCASDSFTLTLPDGTLQRVRIDMADVQSDFSLKLALVTEDADLYSLTATADGGQGHETESVPAPYASRLLLVGAPLLADTDDASGALRGYAAGGGYSDLAWRGGGLFYSRDRVSWEQVQSLGASMAWGTTLVDLAAPELPWTVDRTNTLRISMESGGDDLDTVTEEQMRAGSNTALLVTSEGEVEVIRFANVTANGDGSFTLDTLMRGMRGTEWASGLHAAGSLFVLVDDSVTPISFATGDLGASRYFRLVGAFDTFDAVEIASRTIEGTAEKPYAPCLIIGTRDGSGNLTVSCLRRSRTGGYEWVDGTEGVPLGEETEEYEMDVMDGVTVKRTITSTDGTFAYSAANQVTDFGSAQAEVDVRIYQISATVGRGYPGSATV